MLRGPAAALGEWSIEPLLAELSTEERVDHSASDDEAHSERHEVVGTLVWAA